jgi:hypothetical protein
MQGRIAFIGRGGLYFYPPGAGSLSAGFGLQTDTIINYFSKTINFAMGPPPDKGGFIIIRRWHPYPLKKLKIHLLWIWFLFFTFKSIQKVGQ